jgi:cytochrome b
MVVWDAPVRAAHWLMALSFAGAYLTAENAAWRGVHMALGYTMAGLVVFRIVWGLAGTRYARFSSFLRGPRAVLRYVNSLLRGQPEHYAGHTPTGAVAILALLSLTLLVAASGWATYRHLAGEGMEELHEILANIMLVLVGVHIAAVLATSWLHRENLVMAMIDGRKQGKPEDGLGTTWRGLGLLILAAVLGYWVLAWRAGPGPAGAPAAGAGQAEAHEDES